MAILIGVIWGIWGIIIAKIINAVLIVFLKMFWAANSLETSVTTLLKKIIPATIYTLAAAGSAFLFQYWILEPRLEMRSILNIALSSAVFVSIYLVVSFISSSKDLKMLIRLFRSLVQKFRPIS